jgi:hypothetical protein
MLPATIDTTEDQRLAQLDVARRALQQARTIPEVKLIRDKAAVVEQFFKQQRYSLEVQNAAAEVKLRAERKAGTLLAEMQLHGGDRKSSSQPENLKLADLGLSHNESHRWQTEATLPEPVFETYVATTKQQGKELTSSGVYELAKDTAKALRRQAPVDPGPLRSLAAQLAGLDDLARLEALGIAIQPYDVLHFQGCDPRFGTDGYPGRIPGQLVAHILYWFTEQDAVVLDPMAGGGTVPDVCLVMGRTCYAYDLSGSERRDIVPHNLATAGWPERTKDAHLIVWDPPYFDKQDAGYPDGSISRLEREPYLDFFTKAFTEAHQMVTRGTRLAFLMCDWNDAHDATPKRPGIFIHEYINRLCEAGWHFEEHIQVPLTTQQLHGADVETFRAERKRGRLERYLLIATA